MHGVSRHGLQSRHAIPVRPLNSSPNTTDSLKPLTFQGEHHHAKKNQQDLPNRLKRILNWLKGSLNESIQNLRSWVLSKKLDLQYMKDNHSSLRVEGNARLKKELTEPKSRYFLMSGYAATALAPLLLGASFIFPPAAPILWPLSGVAALWSSVILLETFQLFWRGRPNSSESPKG